MQLSEALAAYLTQLQADGRSTHTIHQARRHARMLIDALGDPPAGHRARRAGVDSDAAREAAGAEAQDGGVIVGGGGCRRTGPRRPLGP